MVSITCRCKWISWSIDNDAFLPQDVELLPLAAQSVKLNGTVKDIKAVKTSDVTYVIVTEQAVTGSAHVLTWNKYSKTLSRVGGEFVSTILVSCGILTS